MSPTERAERIRTLLAEGLAEAAGAAICYHTDTRCAEAANGWPCAFTPRR